MDIIEEFTNELNEGDIRFRDNLQFELKSEFNINPGIKENIYRQDFYLFIPSTLQINANTYSKLQFFQDQTTLIRYKTPEISLSNLIKTDNLLSPLIRLKNNLNDSTYDFGTIQDELQLFANMYRASLRNRILDLLNDLENGISKQYKNITEEITIFCQEVIDVYSYFLNLKNEYTNNFPEKKALLQTFSHIHEFINNMLEYFFTCLLKSIQEMGIALSKENEKSMTDVIKQVQEQSKQHHLSSNTPEGTPHFSEAYLYRNSLLNQFVLEALYLKSNRFSIQEKHAPLLGAITAGIAMFIYMLLFAWNSNLLVINSSPFIMLAVIFYVLKDRIKEGLKSIYYREAFRWFPDYSTEIKDRKGRILGKLNESFTFLSEDLLPKEISTIRNSEFHEELPDLRRVEHIIQYKREVILYQQTANLEKRRRELTTVFRFNTHQFLEKASNPLQPQLTLKNDEIIERLIPKVYHINIIMKNTYLKNDMEIKSEIKKYRVIVDKFGIKRVEHIT